MKLKRLLSAFMSLVMVAVMFSILTVLTVVTVPLTASAATTTERAIFIGSSSKIAAAFIPLNITGSGTKYYKLSFKCKWLKNGDSSNHNNFPSVGILHTTTGGAGQTTTEPGWAGTNYNYTDYNNNALASFSSGTYSMCFAIQHGSCPSTNGYNRGARTFYITIGNAAARNNSNMSFSNVNCSFIFSQVSLYECTSAGAVTGETNLLADCQINDANIDFNGTYFMRAGTCDPWDNPALAKAGKWNILAQPDNVKAITVPSNYNTSSNYDSGFTAQGDTDYIRKYYTNSNYSDLKFALLPNSNSKGYEVIPDDVNKKMFIIGTNDEGETEPTSYSGEVSYTKNKSANIFLPISYGQYSMNAYGSTSDINYIIKVTMTAKRLSGDGAPVLGRIVGKKNDTTAASDDPDGSIYSTNIKGTGSQALPKAAYNNIGTVHLGNYASNPSTYNETINDSSGNRLSFSYNPTTGAYTGWMRVRASDNDYATLWGCNEVITIGNSEHAWASNGKFDASSFNSSFAISNIQVDLYSCPDKSPYNASANPVATNIAPALYADTVDDTSNWSYQHVGDSSKHERDLIRGPQKMWSVDGCTGMVHAENLNTCMKNGHSITYHAATSSTCEYWSCSNCSKNFAEPYCKTELSSTAASKQMIILNSAGNNFDAVFMPLKLSGFTGDQWYKFTCKVKRMAGSGDPKVYTFYADNEGLNKTSLTSTSYNSGNYSVAESSYDASSMTLTAYIKPWNTDNLHKSGNYAFKRYNPISGANLVIAVGNGVYTRDDEADETSGSKSVASAAQYTAFAIAEPALYKVNYTGAIGNLATAKSSSVDTSTNYATPITDKTTDVTYPNASSWSTTWTDSNNPMSAPIGKWYIMNSRTTNANSIYASSVDIPTNYFTAGYSPAKKMIKFAGAQSSMQTNGQYIPFAAVGHLESSTTYQLDYDYREFGGTTHRLEMRVNGSDVTGTTDVANGYHRTVTFKTPAGLPLTGADNFRIEIGPEYKMKYEYSLYLSDIKLRKTSDLNGSNYIINGDFALGSVGVVNWSNYKSQLPGYANNWLVQYNPGARLLSIPSGFFSGTAMAGDTTIALKATGSTDNNGLYFRTHLASSAYYRLSFKYQFYDTGTNNANARTIPTVDIKCRNSSGTDVAPAASSVTKNSGGNYSFTVNFTTPSSMQDSNSVFQANTGLFINFGSSAANKTIYVTDVELYKLSSSGGSVVSNTTGCANLLGNVNAVFDSSLYSGLSSVGNSASVSLGTDNNGAVTSYNMVNGWYKQAGVGNTYLVKVPSDFFIYKTGKQRVETIRHLILDDGEAESDGINPIYNPNGDATWGDVKDLVHTKQVAITNGFN